MVHMGRVSDLVPSAMQALAKPLLRQHHLVCEFALFTIPNEHITSRNKYQTVMLVYTNGYLAKKFKKNHVTETVFSVLYIGIDINGSLVWNGLVCRTCWSC